MSGNFEKGPPEIRPVNEASKDESGNPVQIQSDENIQGETSAVNETSMEKPGNQFSPSGPEPSHPDENGQIFTVNITSMEATSNFGASGLPLEPPPPYDYEGTQTYHQYGNLHIITNELAEQCAETESVEKKVSGTLIGFTWCFAVVACLFGSLCCAIPACCLASKRTYETTIKCSGLGIFAGLSFIMFIMILNKSAL